VSFFVLVDPDLLGDHRWFLGRFARIYSQITLLLFFRNEMDRRFAEYACEWGEIENRILIIALLGAATAFPSPGQASLPRDLSLGGNDENTVALFCKSKSGTRIFNEHTKENRGSDCHPNGLRPRTVGGRSDGPASVIRPYLRQWPVEMSIGPASPVALTLLIN
jgi:hypothetical protein